MNTSIYARQWDVGSFTDATKKPYKVSERRDGGWECSCPAWTRHTPRTDCKHIIKVQKALRFSPQNPVFFTPAPTASKTPATPSTPAVSNPQGCAVIIDGYAIRRRARLDFVELDDTLTSADTDAPAAPTVRSRREL